MANPTTRLEITFCGLCMFVPGDGVLHVLLPATMDMPASSDMGPMRKHLPRVVYSLDYEAKENRSTAVNQANGTASNVERVIDLVGYPVIDWSDLGDKGAVPPLPPGIANASKFARYAVDPGKARVHPDFLGTQLPTTDKCAARITLPGSVTITPYNMAALTITYRGPNGTLQTDKDVMMAACATCAFDIEESTVTLNVNPSRDLKACAGVIRVMFGNMIAGDYEHPPEPFDPKNETHFPAYYNLLISEPADKPVPKKPDVGESSFGVNPITCMLGGGCAATDNC